MSSTLILSIYGAGLSTGLAIFTLFRFFRDQRFLVISVDVEEEDIGESCFDVWLMNVGLSAISIREIMVGSGTLVSRWSLTRYGLSRHSLFRPKQIVAEMMYSELPVDYGKNGDLITIEAGSARKFSFSKSELDKFLTQHRAIGKAAGIEDSEFLKLRHMLEIRHSRSRHPVEIILQPRLTKWEPPKEAYLPSTP